MGSKRRALRYVLLLTLVLIAFLSGCEMIADILGLESGGEDYIPPVSQVEAVYQQDGSILITWQRMDNVDGYDIWVATDNPANFESLGEVWDIASFRHTYLQPNTTYYYQVRAFHDRIWSDFSETASVTTPASVGGEGGGGSGDLLINQLNNWEFMDITVGQTFWYYFDSTPGTTYELLFQDSTDGDPGVSADIQVSVYNADKSSPYPGLAELDAGYTTPHAFTAHTGESTVFLLVEGISDGSFGIRINAITTSTESRLQSITVEDGMLSLNPPFDPDTFTYTLSVTSMMSTVRFQDVWGIDINSEISVTAGGSPVSFAGGSYMVQGITPGAPVDVEITVEATNGVTTSTYSIQIRQMSGNATLSNLSLSAGSLNPSFSPGESMYSVEVGADITEISVTPTAEDPAATITVNDVQIASGTTSAPVNLVFGDNDDVLIVAIEAPDGTQSYYYYISVFRALSGEFDLKVTDAITIEYDEASSTYLASLSTGATATTLYVTPVDPTATVDIDGAAGNTATVSLGDAYTTTTVTVTVAPNYGTGTAENFTIELVPSWTNDAPGDQTTLWYGFETQAGSVYRLQWDDLINGSGTFTSDVVVSVYESDQTTSIPGFTLMNSGFANPPELTAATTDTMYLLVESLDGGFIESFGLRVFDVTGDTWVPFLNTGGTTVIVR